ncbi:MAG: ribonuclease P protein component [Lautropia sp.]
MRVDSDFFDLTDRFKPASSHGDARLVISVPKRLLRSAVQRNTVKRLVREAWRSAGCAGGTGRDCGPVAGPGALLLRLRNLPQLHDAVAPASTPRRRGAAKAQRLAPPSPTVRLGRGATVGGRQWRRVLRADVEGLLGRFCRRLRAGGAREAGRDPGRDPGRTLGQELDQDPR